MNQTARRLIQSRPISTLSVTGISGLCTYGCFVEWQTGKLERQREQRLGIDDGTLNGAFFPNPLNLSC